MVVFPQGCILLLSDCLESMCSNVKLCLIFSSFVFIALVCSAGGSFHFTFLSCLEVKCPKFVAALGAVPVLCWAARVSLSRSPVGRGSLCPALQAGAGTLGMLPCKGLSKPLCSSRQQARLWLLRAALDEVPQVHGSDQGQILLIYACTCILFMLLDVFKPRMVQGCSRTGEYC